MKESFVRRVEIAAWNPSSESVSAQLHLDRYPDYADEVASLVASCVGRVRPRAAWRAEEAVWDGSSLSFGGLAFSGAAFPDYLSDVALVYPYCVTCGPEFDQLLRDTGDSLERYWLDELKALALRDAFRALRADLGRALGGEEVLGAQAKLDALQPGSGNADQWPIEALFPLFRVLGAEATDWTGITLTESCLMIPNKSLAGIFFSGNRTYSSCAHCDDLDCPDRGLASALQEREGGAQEPRSTNS